MDLKDMNLEQVSERLAALDTEVREAATVEAVEKGVAEKKELLARKAELEALEQRKKTALEITAGTVSAAPIEVRKEEKRMEAENMDRYGVIASPEYRSAFYKKLMGRPLSAAEQRTVTQIATEHIEGVIPLQASTRIFEKLVQLAPMLGEVTLLRVPGPVKFGMEGTNTDPAIHTQNALIDPSPDTLEMITLNAYEITKVLRLSKTASAQSIDGFESWLVGYLARGMAKKIGWHLFYGSGSSEPKGLNETVDTWADGTNAVQWNAADPTPAELTKLVGLLGGGYHSGAKWTMNARTLYTHIVPKQSNEKYPILSPDYKILLGFPIMLDDNAFAGDIFFGNYYEGMAANFTQDIRVEKSDQSGFLYLADDYRASAIFDSTPANKNAIVKSAANINLT